MGQASCYISIPNSSYYLSADISWNSSYYVTVNVSTNYQWRLKRSGVVSDTDNIFAQYGSLSNGRFQGQLGVTYVFQMFSQNEKWYQDTFTITDDLDDGGDDGGDDDWYETYTITLRTGGHIWDNFHFDDTYFGHYGEIIDLPAPRRGDDTTPAGNFNIVGNLNGGGTSIAIEASMMKHTTYTFEGWKDLNDNSVYYTTYEIYGDAILDALQSSSSTFEYSNNKIENLGHPTRDEETKTYTITYNYDGGTPSKERETSEARLSYKFNYWCSDSSGTGTKYDDSYEFKNNDGETVNVYAIWTTTAKEPAIINLPATEKVGSKFKGWTTADQAILYEAGTSVEVTKDTEFIAVWESEGQVFIHDGEKWIPII